MLWYKLFLLVVACHCSVWKRQKARVFYTLHHNSGILCVEHCQCFVHSFSMTIYLSRSLSKRRRQRIDKPRNKSENRNDKPRRHTGIETKILHENQRSFSFENEMRVDFLFGFIYSCVYDRAQSYHTSIVTAIQSKYVWDVRWCVVRAHFFLVVSLAASRDHSFTL